MLERELNIHKKQYPWPDNYYMATSPQERLEYLQEAMHEDNSPENELRLLLWKKRYANEQGTLDGIDHFLKMWTNLPYAVKQKDSLLGKRFVKKFLKEWKETFQFEELNKHPACKDVWYREFINFVCFYIQICKTDKTYSTTLFGIGKLSDQTLAAKLAEDLCQRTIHLPKILGIQEDQQLLADAAKEAFSLYFPEQENLFDRYC